MADRPVADSYKSRKDLEPIDWTTFRYMREDPMYAYCQKQKEKREELAREEKLKKVKELKALLNSSDSSSSSAEDNLEKKHKKKKKLKKKDKHKERKKQGQKYTNDIKSRPSKRKRTTSGSDSDSEWIEVTHKKKKKSKHKEKNSEKDKKRKNKIGESIDDRKDSDRKNSEQISDGKCDIDTNGDSRDKDRRPTEGDAVLEAIREIRYSTETWHKISRRTDTEDKA